MNMNLEATETIVANIASGLLFIALTPTLFSLLLEVGAPTGRTQAVQFGFYLALMLSGWVLLALAYKGYTER